MYWAGSKITKWLGQKQTVAPLQGAKVRSLNLSSAISESVLLYYNLYCSDRRDRFLFSTHAYLVASKSGLLVREMCRLSLGTAVRFLFYLFWYPPPQPTAPDYGCPLPPSGNPAPSGNPPRPLPPPPPGHHSGSGSGCGFIHCRDHFGNGTIFTGD